MEAKKKVLIYHDWEENGLSYRTLSKRYGVSVGSIHRMIKQLKEDQQAEKAVAAKSAMPDDVKALQEALRLERLRNELLNAVIDISSKELGIDLRKKHGTRQSS